MAKATSGLTAAGFGNVSVLLNPPRIQLESEWPVSRDENQTILSRIGAYEIEPFLQQHPVSQTSETND